MTVWLILVAILLLIAMSAFFSGSETALTAASRARMHQLEKSGEHSARTVNALLARRERLIGALLLGNNLVNILASALATSVFIALFGDAGVAIATIVMTLTVLIFAELLPKTWAITIPDRFALAVAPFVAVVTAVLGPAVKAVEMIVDAILRLLGVDAHSDTVLSARDELRGAVDLLHREGGVVKDERDRLGGLLDLSELEVSDIMVHRTNMQALNADDPPEALVAAVMESNYTRLPLWRDKTDNIIGVLHAKDILRALTTVGGDASKIDIASVATEPWFVPDTTSLQAQLNAFLRRKAHFALVVDEYGEVMGLVTLEDILEEIVGEIADEFDIDIPGARPQADGSVMVEGSLPIRDLNRALDWSLPDEEANTIAGLVIHEAQTIPEVGQAFTFYGYRFRVIRKSRNRITQLKVTPLDRPPKPAVEPDTSTPSEAS